MVPLLSSGSRVLPLEPLPRLRKFLWRSLPAIGSRRHHCYFQTSFPKWKIFVPRVRGGEAGPGPGGPWSDPIAKDWAGKREAASCESIAGAAGRSGDCSPWNLRHGSTRIRPESSTCPAIGTLRPSPDRHALQTRQRIPWDVDISEKVRKKKH